MLQRIQIEGIRKDPWFQKHYVPVTPRDEEVNLDDVSAVFNDIEVGIHSYVLWIIVPLLCKREFLMLACRFFIFVMSPLMVVIRVEHYCAT